MDLTRWTLRDCGTTAVTLTNIHSLLWGWSWKLLLIMGPLLLTVAVMRWPTISRSGLSSSEALAPEIRQDRPHQGLPAALRCALVERVKSLVKMGVVAYVVWFTLKEELPNVIPPMEESVWGILLYTGRPFKILITTCWILVVLAILDYIYQRWEYEKGPPDVQAGGQG